MIEKRIYYTRIKTHIKDVILAKEGEDSGIVYAGFDTEKGRKKSGRDETWIERNSYFEAERKEVEAFFSGKQNAFFSLLAPKGTSFQLKVWEALKAIPFGQTCSYKDIAIAIGNEKASRAVGMANNRNPIGLIIPCHRVIGASGKLVGYAGGLDVKERLLGFERLTFVFQELLKTYGEQEWWPADTAFEMMLGAILTQNTTWVNVEKAIFQLKKHLQGDLNPEKVEKMEIETLASCIQSSGYYNQKAKKIKAFTAWFKQYKYQVDALQNKSDADLREELLSIHGVGKETADSMLLYAWNRPVFIVDTYTRRFFNRLGFSIPKDYDAFRLWIESLLKKDVTVYQEYHALIVQHAKMHCMKTPACETCFLNAFCKQGKKVMKRVGK